MHGGITSVVTRGRCRQDEWQDSCHLDAASQSSETPVDAASRSSETRDVDTVSPVPMVRQVRCRLT